MPFLKKLVPFAVVVAFIGTASAQNPDRPAAAAAAGPQGLVVQQFGSVLPESIKWQSFPAFPPDARLAVVVGDPSKAGPYVVRVNCPPACS